MVSWAVTCYDLVRGREDWQYKKNHLFPEREEDNKTDTKPLILYDKAKGYNIWT